MIEIKCDTKDSLPLEALTDLQGDLKTLSKENAEKLKGQIRENGFIVPFFVWRDEDIDYSDPSIDIKEVNYILDGHQRQEVLRQMEEAGEELPDRFPVVYVEASDEKDAKKKLLAINSQYGKMTEEGLFNLMEEIDFVFEDLEEFEFAGIDMMALEGLFDEPKHTKKELDSVPEIRETDIKRGDMFQLGHHRLMCGDSTSKGDVERLMDGEKAILMITDPPYGVEYDPAWREKADKSAGLLGNKYPVRALGKVKNDDRIDWSEAFSLFMGDIMYIWHAGKFTSKIQQIVEDLGFEIISHIVWVKPHFALSRGDYHWRHEPCWYAVRKGKKHNWQGSRKESTVWEIAGLNAFGGTQDPLDDRTEHGTQKPIECMRRPIINNSRENELIYDPFLGSGSTLIACERANKPDMLWHGIRTFILSSHHRSLREANRTESR